MKISGNDGSSQIKELLQRIGSEEAASKEQQQAQESQAAPRGEKVEISSRAREIQRLESALNEMPDVRAEKVEEIKNLIAEGNYETDTGKLADKIIEALILGDL
jgi:negative regulator of flagellin synthesis FlgM